MCVALIDTGATGNYLARRIVLQDGLSIRPKVHPYRINVASGEPLPGSEGVTQEAYRICVEILKINKFQWMTFDVLEMATHDIVLGMPWLQRNNPTIDWVQRIVTFTETNGDRLVVKA